MQYNHRQNQIRVINKLAKQIKIGSLRSSTVLPVENFDMDSRLTLTVVHLPNKLLTEKLRKTIIEPLKRIYPQGYYYANDSLHITIKNIKAPSDPPTFSESDIVKAETVFSHVIPRHKKFRVYFYRLIQFPNSLSLVGATDPELDKIIEDLNTNLNKFGIPDDKKYVNSKYYFCNINLVRFNTTSPQFDHAVRELSQNISIKPYRVDSVCLITANTVLKNLRVIKTLKLK